MNWDDVKLESKSVSTDDLKNMLLPDYEFHTNPWHHQVVATAACICNERLGVFLDMRLGKCKVTVDVFRELRRRGLVKNCIVLTLRTMILEFADEIRLHGPDIPVHVDTGGNKNRRRAILDIDEGIAISNHEVVKVLPELMKKFDMAVFDESTVYRNYKSKLTKETRKVFSKTRFKYLLSGVAGMANHLSNLFGQYSVLFDKDSPLGTNFFEFRSKYFIEVGSTFPDWRLRESALDRIEVILRETSIRYTKEECTDVPPRIITRLPVMMTPEQTKLTVVELEDGKIDSYTRMQEIASGWLRKDDKETVFKNNPKLDAVVDLCKNHDGKTIVWCRFLNDMSSIVESLNKAGITSVRIDGKTRQKTAHDNANRFRNDDDVRVLVAQIESVSRGFTLKEADMMIFFSYDWDAELYYQALERNFNKDRPGGSHVWLLVASHPDGIMSIDELILEAYDRKMNVVNFLKKSGYIKDACSKTVRRMIDGKA